MPAAPAPAPDDALPPARAGATKSARTRAQILQGAARLFRHRGHGGATLRQIAAAAGLEAGSLYYHFASKEEILEAVLDLGVRHLAEAVGAVRAGALARGTPFAEAFPAMVETHLALLLRDSDFTSANIRNYPTVAEALRARHRPLRRAYAALWEQTLESAQAEGAVRGDLSPVLLRQIILGALNFTVEWFDPARQSTADLAAQVTGMVCDGLAVTPAAPGTGASGWPAAPPPAAAPADGREQVLLAAARVLRDGGLAAATMREIALAAGMEAGSVYHHFASKDALLDAVLDRGLRDMLEGAGAVFAAGAASADRRQAVADGIRAHLLWLHAMSTFTSANIRIHGHLPDEVRARHRPLRQAYARMWEAELAQAQHAGAIRADLPAAQMRRLMLGALNWTVEWFDPARAGRPGYLGLPDLSAMLETLLLDGLRGPRAAGREKA